MIELASKINIYTNPTFMLQRKNTKIRYVYL